MNPHAVAQVVARLYTAAGRHYGEVELQVYADALEDLDDRIGVQAAGDVIRAVDLGLRAPSPKLVIDAAVAIRRRGDGLPMITPPAHEHLSMAENAKRMREAAAMIRRRREEALTETPS